MAITITVTHIAERPVQLTMKCVDEGLATPNWSVIVQASLQPAKALPERLRVPIDLSDLKRVKRFLKENYPETAESLFARLLRELRALKTVLSNGAIALVDKA